MALGEQQRQRRKGFLEESIVLTVHLEVALEVEKPMLACITDHHNFIFGMENDSLNVAGVPKLVAKFEIFTRESLSIEAKEVDKVLTPSHHDDRTFRFEVEG